MNLRSLPRQGILYVATGQQHCDEACQNAAASLPYAGGRPIYLITDCSLKPSYSELFNRVIAHPSPVRGYRDKISGFLSLPFPETLFLDSDAQLTASADDLFLSLGHADLAAVHAPVRIPSGWQDPDVPSLFSEINSGVLLWRRSRKQRNFVKRWLSLYDQILSETGLTWDQASLRSVLWNFCQYRRFVLTILPAEANFRTTKPWVAGKGLAVHVLHGRIPRDELPLLLDFLNADVHKFRTWVDWFKASPSSKIRLRVGQPSPRPPT